MILLRTLGDCTIEIGESRLAPDSEILFSLLTYLIVERGRPIARSTLVELFWPNEEDSKARHCLRQSVYKLRKMGVPIETRNDRYIMQANTARVDWEDFENGKPVEHFLDDSVLHVLPAFQPKVSKAYNAWLETLRDRGSVALRRTLVSGIRQARKVNDWVSARRVAEQCLKVDRLNEEATLTLAESLALAGEKERAMRLLHAYADDVGILHSDLRIPASILSRRISERITIARGVQHPPTFVGRRGSMDWLARAARRVSRGAGQTCVIRGSPGIGKSRLVSEFTNIASLEGYRTVRVECRSHAKDRALCVFMEIAPQLLRLPGALGCSPSALAYVRRLGEQPPAPILEESETDSRSLHEKVRESLLDLIDALAAEQPLAIAVEDVQWLDHVSSAILREIIDSNSRRALLLILTTRPDGGPQWMIKASGAAVICHELAPLTVDESRQLALQLSASNSGPAPHSVIDWCTTHGCGNPLFIGELARHWKESGSITEIPASLEGVIDERVSQLSVAAITVLQAMAILGRHSTYDRIDDLLGLPRWQLLEAVQDLSASGLSLRLGDVLQPAHDLIASAALRNMSADAEALVHAAVAKCLELSNAEHRDATLMWDAATHWSRSGNQHRALALAHRCAQHLLTVGLPHEASELLDKALAFAQTDEEKLSIYHARRTPLLQAGDWSGVLANCESGLAIERSRAPEGLTGHSILELDYYAAHCAAFSSDSAKVVEQATMCAEDALAPVSHRIAAASRGLAACYAEGRPDEAKRLISAVNTMTPATLQDSRDVGLCRLIFHIEYGDLLEAAHFGDELLAQAEKAGIGKALSRYVRLSSYAYRMLGKFDIVNERLKRARQMAASSQLQSDYREALVATLQSHCAVEEEEACWAVVGELTAMFASRPYLGTPGAYHMCAEAAHLRGDLTQMGNFLQRAAEFPTMSAKHRSDRLALTVAYDLATSNNVDSERLSDLLSAHERVRLYTGQEFLTCVLCSALAAHGREAEARSVARTYAFHQRRERYPVKKKALMRFLDA